MGALGVQAVSNLVWSDGRWFYRADFNCWTYRKPGQYDPRSWDNDPANHVELTAVEVRQLITSLDEAGWITPRLDERLRTEDLKITHRLIDLLEKKR